MRRFSFSGVTQRSKPKKVSALHPGETLLENQLLIYMYMYSHNKNIYFDRFTHRTLPLVDNARKIKVLLKY